MAILDFVLHRTDIPGETLGECRISIGGEESVCVENHRGLLEYSADTLSLARKGGTVSIRGTGLEIVAMDSEIVLVKGHISAVDLE